MTAEKKTGFPTRRLSGHTRLMGIADETTPTTPWNERHRLELDDVSHALRRRVVRAQKHGGAINSILKRHRVRGAKF